MLGASGRRAGSRPGRGRERWRRELRVGPPGLVGRRRRGRGRGPHVVEARPRRIARRQRDADDWVRLKTPAWRTSCINRSFSCRTANKQKTHQSVTMTAQRMRGWRGVVRLRRALGR
ncbi:hypothetical protein EVAR_11709_1 [Eumeta japonica]|uniref:Uncharacterized protein n=1 Tax=Eumeta variegata TaxID=151549 RepID=A0A4C1U4K1_EUMVA|nr:hypothetical protein EVAR_11709_1 [Eumeta japonica]